MERKKKCDHCRKSIETKDHQVQLTTRNKGKVTEDVHFHLVCWSDYYNKAVLNKSKKNLALIQKKAVGLFENPMLKGLLSNIKGTDELMVMLQTPLIDDVSEKENKKNGKTKNTKRRTKKTTKTKM